MNKGLVYISTYLTVGDCLTCFTENNGGAYFSLGKIICIQRAKSSSGLMKLKQVLGIQPQDQPVMIGVGVNHTY
uniref:Uncharacterized protein n=1 Tax=Megaselia scalaris TaxID=36166 RepID=T1GDG1_MEGSC